MNPQRNVGDEFGANDWLIEEMLEQFNDDPDSVDPAWRAYFEQRQKPAAAAQPQPAAAPKADAKPAKPEAVQPTPAPKPAPAAAPKAATTKAAEAKPSAPQQQAPAVKAEQPAKSESKPAKESKSVDKAEEKPKAVPADPAKSAKTVTSGEATRTVLKGAPMRTARNMEASIQVPTATTVRDIPMKLIIENRTEINNHLKRSRGGKISFTHIIGYAMVQAIKAVPAMNNHFEDDGGKAVLVQPGSINLGIAIDVKKADGTRNLMVPCIKGAEQLDFSEFVDKYEELVKKGRTNTLGVDDFAGTTVSLTNPGGIGTNHSLARLMAGQGCILGVGAVDYPAEFRGTAQGQLDQLAISKITTFTSTYDHRVIQGAQSGEFLKRLSELLLGEHGFYDHIYDTLRVPHPPLTWARDEVEDGEAAIPKAARVLALIEAYRQFGHLAAATDPLEFRRRTHPDLELASHGLTIWDLDRRFPTGRLGEHQVLKLREILDVLRDTYCRTSTVEYMYIADPQQRSWFQRRVERPHEAAPRQDQLRILDRLIEADIFETFLQTKFIGQKRFSLEGGEATIVLLDRICSAAAGAHLTEVCIGMPHRGRLNVLTNIVGKSYSQVFREFQEKIQADGSGDVKYHLGAEGAFTAANGDQVAVSVAANPSHLEAVNPVVEGITRAKQDQIDHDSERDFSVLPILLHGDASFAGQGINFETMQMARLRGYNTGGTIHLVVNNQVGFTTSPSDSRSTTYCTDLAKAFEAPVFHVNGDDPEACVRVAQLAFEYREKFHHDVVIDLVCYRLRGHNEGDDPSFTQPIMYDLIDAKRSTRRLYTEALIGRGDISAEEAEEIQKEFHARLEKVFKELKSENLADDHYTRVPAYPPKPVGSKSTAVGADLLDRVAAAYRTTPEGFTLHPKVEKQLRRRADDIDKGTIDWATGEALAFASLALEGHPVRLSGQDSQRGTFAQRYGIVVDRANSDEWTPLNDIADEQARISIYNSLLSEYAAMGFEYGYSVARPQALVLWEAQYGDFANGAQTIADEFISSGKAKWGQNSGVVLLLPHGYEGHGPDHSSARIERWLQLCSEGALAVCQPSTSASYFHLLRQHVHVNWHRPVVILTPKSMLRAKPAQCGREAFLEGSWQPALGDPSITNPESVKRVVLCSGKIRWELMSARDKAEQSGDVAIVSLERLYPLPVDELVAELAKYPNATSVRWVQDEPENQGAWYYLAQNLPARMTEATGKPFTIDGIGRPTASAPAVGSHHVHDEQQAALLAAALAE